MFLINSITAAWCTCHRHGAAIPRPRSQPPVVSRPVDWIDATAEELIAALSGHAPELVDQVIPPAVESAVRGVDTTVEVLRRRSHQLRDDIEPVANAVRSLCGHMMAVHNSFFLGALSSRYPWMVGESTTVPIARLQTWLRSHIIRCVSHISRHPKGNKRIRNVFRELQPETPYEETGNPHDHHAQIRASARKFAKELAKARGLNVVRVQKPGDGFRPPKLTTPKPLFVLIDSDYYLQEWQLTDLLNLGPVLMYTYSLDRLGHNGEQGQFRFSEGILTASFTGGGVYRHRLWDWSHDQLLLSGAGYSSIRVNVDSKSMDDVCRSIVLLTPTQHFPWPAYHAAHTLYSAPRLTRLVPDVIVDKTGELIVESLTSGADVSILMNRSVSFQLDRDVYLNLVSAAKQSQHLSVSTILRETGDERVYLLKEILKAAAQTPLNLPVDRPKHFVPIFSNLYDENKEGGTIVTKPIISGALFPAASLASDRAGVAGRCEDVRCKEEPVAQDIADYSAEFRAHLVDHLGDLRPKTIEEILDTCPSKDFQKWVRADDPYVIPEKLHKTFMKLEAYPEVKDPRDIKDVPKTLVLHLSKFVHAVVAALKVKVKWYGFGMTTREIARRVMRVCEGKTRVCPTDFSRFDGTQGEFLFSEFVKDLLALFPPDYHKEIKFLFKQLHDKLHVTRYGHVFMVLYSMMSGSADTSCRNTIHNARANYISLRRCGLSPQEAWDRLGLYGGDDGLTSYPDPEIAKKTMLELGLKLKIEELVAPQPIPFLGRIYFSPWDRTNSCHEISRAANKVHMSPHNADNIDPRQMAWRKAVSLWVTDSQTPVLNVWARNVLRLVPTGVWEATWLEKVYDNFPLANGKKYLSQKIMENWSEPIYDGPTLEDASNALAAFLDVEGISPDAYDQWVDAMDKAQSFDEFPEPLKEVDFITLTGIPCVVDEQFSGPPMKPTDRIVCARYLRRKPCAQNCPDHHPKRFCFDFVNGKCTREQCRFPHIAYNQRFEDSLVERRPRNGGITLQAFPVDTAQSGPSIPSGPTPRVHAPLPTPPAPLAVTGVPTSTRFEPVFTRKGRTGKRRESTVAK